MIPCAVKNPVVTTNGKAIVLPVQMLSGSYVEFSAMNDCELYGSKGQSLAKVEPAGSIPVLSPGENKIRFSCDAVVDAPAPRVKITVISHGGLL